MARGMPSMTALLAMLAMAGYQNRDKLGELLGSARGGSAGARPGGMNSGMADEGGRFGGSLGGMGSGMAGAGIGGMLSEGLRDLVDRFRGAGHGEAAESWIAHGPNRPVEATHLESALGADTLASLEQQTGLSRAEILQRLSRELPEAVDRYTPDGRIPDA